MEGAKGAPHYSPLLSAHYSPLHVPAVPSSNVKLLVDHPIISNGAVWASVVRRMTWRKSWRKSWQCGLPIGKSAVTAYAFPVALGPRPVLKRTF
eukprot:5470745-Pyramimonas_sp.AAC.1